jgi:serine/threonine protein kinase
VHTLSLVAYEVVTGVRPFAEQNFALLIKAMLNRKPQKPSVLTKELSTEFDALVLKALEKNPAARYRTAGERLGDFKKLWALLQRPILSNRNALRVSYETSNP